MSRRAFLWCGVTAAGVGVRGFSSVLPSVFIGPRFDYGPLRPAAAENSGERFLALPEGFRYTVFGRAGDPMSDGSPTPILHDGMAAFSHGSEIRLVRNHEIFDQQPRPLGPPDRSYDRRGGGGTTTLIVDPATRTLIRDFVSLSGTSGNCSGGTTPWGSWISCEETVNGPSKGFEKKHGYCFEVPSSADGPVIARPIREMGRFEHEAIAVDPITGSVYLTEDQPTAGFYRFLPSVPGDLSAGGRLQMLGVAGSSGFDARRPLRRGKPLPVSWIDIDDPDPSDAEDNPGAVYRQGASHGAATFSRLEGATYFDGSVYFDSTDGGRLGFGQIWRYVIRPASSGRRRTVTHHADAGPSHARSGKASQVGGETEGTLILVYESENKDELDGPDNVCMSPRRDLVICEDGTGETQSLRGFTRSGTMFEIARNIIDGFTDGELAGATFSPDGETLFVNIQRPGITLAIWGPW